jgi:hypothetical protein
MALGSLTLIHFQSSIAIQQNNGLNGKLSIALSLKIPPHTNGNQSQIVRSGSRHSMSRRSVQQSMAVPWSLSATRLCSILTSPSSFSWPTVNPSFSHPMEPHDPSTMTRRKSSPNILREHSFRTSLRPVRRWARGPSSCS